MTEYEAADLMATYSSNLIEGQALFITIFTAYMVVAYTVGKELSRFQYAFVTFSFLLFVILATQGSGFSLETTFFYADQLSSIRGDDEFADETAKSAGRSLFYGVRILLVAGALAFMWQVRRSKTD